MAQQRGADGAIFNGSKCSPRLRSVCHDSGVASGRPIFGSVFIAQPTPPTPPTPHMLIASWPPPAPLQARRVRAAMIGEAPRAEGGATIARRLELFGVALMFGSIDNLTGDGRVVHGVRASGWGSRGREKNQWLKCPSLLKLA